MGKLTTKEVENAPPGRLIDGDGLCLITKPSGSKSWILRVQHNGKRRDIGLGSLSALGLAGAREKARELRKHALNGRDPVAERKREKDTVKTFRDATFATHEALKSRWVEKNAAAFLSSLEAYAFPEMGNLHVATITAGHIVDLLQPIWIEKPEVARKVRMRIGQVLNFSHSKGWRPAEAPGRSVTMGLGKQPKASNFAAMPYEDVPAFFDQLRSSVQTKGRQALQLVILTGARSGEVRHARWGQFNLDRAEWRRPAELMKSREAHLVTLNAPAVALLRGLIQGRQPKPDELVFSSRRDTPLSDMTLTKVVRSAGEKFTVHGFRSSFRDWAAEHHPDLPDAVAEAALAHAEPDKVVRAYKRTTLVRMRQQLLQAWGAFVTCEDQA
ncbi:tyrosine-type recombinase/integrase [Sphingomonas sp. RHCKR47]|uniref:tyrosine-type recombinase/integrase n=1 Tax=Sphingomonas citricola TaxID=2862498 RepID=UPI001CA532CB|nr:integrase arm-type DNA-binding domain-containing protein [Sphingomonas citricola]MBW6522495.1 tyrosine-type recombinase/integrase [Sphingomonas citricola]